MMRALGAHARFFAAAAPWALLACGGPASVAEAAPLPSQKKPPLPLSKAPLPSHPAAAGKKERVVKLEAAEPISLPPGTPLAVPSVFASHMVVPAGVDFTIWGLAAVGTGPVNVTMNGHSASAKLDGDGRWTVTLPAMNVSKAPTSIGISSAKSKIELEDVLVGDVYVCMGGYDMATPLGTSGDSSGALELAQSLGDRLRIMSVKKQKACCANPQDNFTARIPWQRTSSEGHTDSFSALCYHFGVEQLDARPDLPVGLIQVTAKESQSWQWAPPHSATACQKPSDVADDTVGIYWNSMLRPLAALKGPRAFLYELGGDRCVSIDMLQQMQEIWRASRQGDPEMPAVIGAQNSCTSPAELTRADYDYRQALERLPRSSVAVTSDLCTVNARGCGSHSPFKREEAKRLAMQAERLLYGMEEGVPANAPRPVHVFVDRYEPSWGDFHYGVVGDFTCHTCVWGMRVVFDQDVMFRPEFEGFKGGHSGHVNGFQLYPNTKPGLDYFPVTMQLNWVGGNTVQLNATIKVGALGVDSPWPGRLQYGEGPFPVMPLVSGATGEPVPQLSIEVPLGDGKDELKKLEP